MLYLGIMVHLEHWDDDKDQAQFEEHARLIREYASTFETYGAKLTLESKEVTAGSLRWGDNVLLEMEQRGHGIGGGRDGVMVHNVLASYAHLRHTGGNDWPRRFMAFVRDVKHRDEAQVERLRPVLQEEPAWSTR